MKRLSGVLFTLLFSLCSLGFSIFSVAYNTSDYHAFQQRFNIEEATGKTQQELDIVNRDIVLYLQTGEPSRMSDHFGERECAHMEDVFGLFSLARVVSLIGIAGASAFLVARCRDQHPQAAYVAWLTQGAVFVLLAGVAFLATQSWETVFTTFHHVFFRNDLWILNVDTDLMIQMMPAPFFMAMAKGIALRFVVGTLLGQGLWTLAGRHRMSTKKVMPKGEKDV